jgi:fucose 4-O-acetylase-like acetyltransferase
MLGRRRVSRDAWRKGASILQIEHSAGSCAFVFTFLRPLFFLVSLYFYSDMYASLLSSTSHFVTRSMG